MQVCVVNASRVPLRHLPPSLITLGQEFLMVRPTPENLKLYEDWIRSPTQSQVFFGDLVDVCYRCESSVPPCAARLASSWHTSI